jgi:phosphate acetyltransferase
MQHILHQVRRLPRRTLLFPESADRRILKAAQMANRDFANVVLLSKTRSDIPNVLRAVGNVPVIVQRENLLDFGHGMLVNGDVDCMVSGAIYESRNVLRSAIKHLSKRGRTVSSFFFMDFNNRRKPLVFADCAVVPIPTAMQLRDIAIEVCQIAQNILVMNPRVAFLSYSTKGSGDDENIYRIQRAVRAMRAKAPNIIADGEMQSDAAIIPIVAQKKAPYSPIQGNANVLIFPSLESGNIAYKLVERLSGCSAVGPILIGLDKPSNDLSRGCSVQDIYNVAAITCLQVNKKL